MEVGEGCCLWLAGGDGESSRGHTSSGIHGERPELRMAGEKERELNQGREGKEKGRGSRSYEVGSTELG